MITRLSPTADDVEPVYIYDNPDEHMIVLSGQYIDQKGLGRIRSISTTPADMDRFCRTPLLQENSNLDYATRWSGAAMNAYQRELNVDNMAGISEWWNTPTSLSPNAPLIWIPAGIVGIDFDQQNQPQCYCAVSPTMWAVQNCPSCGADAMQYGVQFEGHFFDHCRAHGCGWIGRPAHVIDGQHRIRGIADRAPAGALFDQPIFANIVVNQPPNAIDPMNAARMFIEINAGAAPLERLHADYLKSYFSLFEYSDVNRRRAYEIAVDLNRGGPGRPNEWYEDTGGRSGRVTMLDRRQSVNDYIPAWRVAKWARDTVGRNFSISPGGGVLPPSTVYTWVPGIVPDIVSQLSFYLQAITNVWPGAAGPKSLPTWRTNRGNPKGELQAISIFRVFLNIFPTICLRVDNNGAARNTAGIQNELTALANIPWTGPWNSSGGWLTGDTGVSSVSRVLNRLLQDLPLVGPWPGGAWPGITAWFGEQHDPFQIINPVSSVDELRFDTQTTCSIQTTISTRVSLHGSGFGLVSIEHRDASGIVGNYDVPTILEESGTNVINLGAQGITPSVGDILEIQVSTCTNNNDTPVSDNDTISGTPITIIVT